MGNPMSGRRALVASAAVILATGCAGGGGVAETTSDAVTAATSTVTPGLVPVTDIVKAGAKQLQVLDADWVQVVDGDAWTTLASGRLQQLHGTTGAPGFAVPVSPETCTAMDVGDGSVWVGVCSNPSQVLRVDPRSGKVQARISLPGMKIVEEGSVGSGEGAVWVVTTPHRQLVRIDPSANKVVKVTAVPDGVVAARAGLGALWITNPERGELLRLNPKTSAVEATIKVGRGARFFDVGEGAVWVQNNDDATVSRVDPKSNRVVATIRVDEGAVSGGDLAVGGGYVWARVTSALVAKIDPATNTVIARYGPRLGSGSVAADESAAWITAHDADAVYRLPLN
jgi:hypothetical protein